MLPLTHSTRENPARQKTHWPAETLPHIRNHSRMSTNAAPGAAGVSQPWRTIRSRVVNVITPTPRKQIAIAGGVFSPTAG
jgi:hypothetical protein